MEKPEKTGLEVAVVEELPPNTDSFDTVKARLKSSAAQAMIGELKGLFNNIESAVITRTRIDYPIKMAKKDVIVPEEMVLRVVQREKGAAAEARKYIVALGKERNRREKICGLCSQLSKMMSDGFVLIIKHGEATVQPRLQRSTV